MADASLPGRLSSDFQFVLDGAIFVLQSPLALAAALVTCVLLASVTARTAVVRALAFALIASVGGSMAPSLPAQAAVPAALLVLGLTTACGLQLNWPFAGLAIALGGLAAGWAGGMQTAAWQEAMGGGVVLGGLVCGLLLGLLGLRATPARFALVVSVGRRVIGAWIGALGALLLALVMRAGAG